MAAIATAHSTARHPRVVKMAPPTTGANAPMIIIRFIIRAVWAPRVRSEMTARASTTPADMARYLVALLGQPVGTARARCWGQTPWR
jgi:hypothetical protein